MTSIEHTAYPRLKRTLTPKELDQIYTPTPAELFLAQRRLGYAVAKNEIPASIVDHIAARATLLLSPHDLVGYDDSGTRRRHLPSSGKCWRFSPAIHPLRKHFFVRWSKPREPKTTWPI